MNLRPICSLHPLQYCANKTQRGMKRCRRVQIWLQSVTKTSLPLFLKNKIKTTT